ncbi:MAG: lysine-2,3-aminomutase-like protein [Rhodospirillaceae bacterium]
MADPGDPGTLRSVAALVRAGLVPAGRAGALSAVAARYAVAVPPALAALIRPGDAADPIGRQLLPDEAELRHAADERADPIGDGAHAPVPGIVHRYPDRVLLTPTFVCALYCRFCFRRERVGGGEALDPEALAAALDYIRARPEIREVILTGGDPLMLTPDRLGGIVAALDAMPGIGVIRLHTRVPVAAPERVTAALLAALTSETALFLAVHANHPREFSPAVRASLRRLAGAGVALLGQSVLLAGVNDDAATLEALMRGFIENRVKPYYLHQLDPAPGTARFRVPVARGQALMRGLLGRVSGLALPAYVLDIPDGYGKSPIGPGYLSADGGEISDWRGGRHRL